MGATQHAVAVLSGQTHRLGFFEALNTVLPIRKTTAISSSCCMSARR
jgi:hypothetical protein